MLDVPRRPRSGAARGSSSTRRSPTAAARRATTRTRATSRHADARGDDRRRLRVLSPHRPGADGGQRAPPVRAAHVRRLPRAARVVVRRHCSCPSQRDLCFGCHPGTAAALGRGGAARPVRERHAAPAATARTARSFTPLLATPRARRCATTATAASAASSRGRAATPCRRGSLCSDCHRPHAAPVRGLLPVAQRRAVPRLPRRCVRDSSCARSCTRRSRTATARAATSRTAPRPRRCCTVSDPALCRRCHPDIPARPRPLARRGPSAPARAADRWQSARTDRLPADRRAAPRASPTPSVSPGPGVAASGRDVAPRPAAAGSATAPHASDYQRLLVRAGRHALPALPRPRRRRACGASAHRSLTCERCHTPHHARASPLLVRTSIAVCTGCHPGYTHAGQRPPRRLEVLRLPREGPAHVRVDVPRPARQPRTREMLRVPYETDGLGQRLHLPAVPHEGRDRLY